MRNQKKTIVQCKMEHDLQLSHEIRHKPYRRNHSVVALFPVRDNLTALSVYVREFSSNMFYMNDERAID